MRGPKSFVDTNVLLYLLSSDAGKADRTEALLRAGVVISVQVLNEITNVARRKLAMSWSQIEEIITSIRALCPPEPLTIATHECGRMISQRYGLSVYDAMIAASALLCECKILYSEDMHDGLIIEKELRICNPFTA
jgi:predicted nucleic acid-binding protein